MKRILYIGNFKLPDRNAAAHRVFANGLIFKKLGYETTYSGIDESNSRMFVEKSEVFNDFEYKTWNRPSNNNLFSWIKHLFSISQYKKILNSSNDFKLVILYDFPSVATYLLKIYCKKQNIKIVSDVTEWYENKWSSLRGVITSIDFYFRMHLSNHKMDGLILISSFLIKHFKNKTTILVPPLIDSKSKKWQNIDSYNKNDGVIRLIYYGNPGKKENFENIFKSFASGLILNLELTILGISKTDFFRNRRELLRYFDGSSTKIKFLDNQTHENTINELKKSDFSIFFRNHNRNTKAGFPTKLVESLSAGIPVITNETSDIAKYVKMGVNGFLLKYNTYDEVLNVLLTVSKLNTDQIRKMKFNCFLEKSFDYNNYTEKFKRFFSDIGV